ncbi:hypothetical protein [Chamaesiphon sp. VAR_48_metabat_403]|uniref:hypothetical protein n=1 Tax=Chamaesiphon sp. VAR_48_metabat_403 TaxID=2964700 RepID=UPI00286E0658|nr:hypothetical protein [Chamaesiphon sp. VAR_48_metabat_403]
MVASQTFQQFIGDFGTNSWLVLFVKAPIDIVSTTYAEILSCEVDRNIPFSLISLGSESYGANKVIVEIADSDWTIIFHIIGDYDIFDAQQLSSRLNVSVLKFFASDTSATVGCRLFSPDEATLLYRTSNDYEDERVIYDKEFEYTAELGMEISQSTGSIIIESYENFFESLGIKTVNLSINKSRTVVAIEDNQRSQVLQVDLVKL